MGKKFHWCDSSHSWFETDILRQSNTSQILKVIVSLIHSLKTLMVNVLRGTHFKMNVALDLRDGLSKPITVNLNHSTKCQQVFKCIFWTVDEKQHKCKTKAALNFNLVQILWWSQCVEQIYDQFNAKVETQEIQVSLKDVCVPLVIESHRFYTLYIKWSIIFQLASIQFSFTIVSGIFVQFQLTNLPNMI